MQPGAQLGVWKVTPAGAVSLVAGPPQGAAPNGIAYHDGWLYVADTLLGQVRRVHSDGAGAPEVWSNDSLLTPLFLSLVPGPTRPSPSSPAPPRAARASCV